MPTFDLVALDEARVKTTTGKRAGIIKEYSGYLEQLKTGRAGRLQAGAGETIGAVRRRLGAAARLAGKDLTIKRVGDEIFFWTKSGKAGASRRPGRPRKSAS